MEDMEDIVGKLRETFREEAYELLAELEAGLLELEHNPGDMEQVGRVFRAMHTIKGSGATCEFHNIATFTHELETAFDKVRKGKMAATKELIDLALTSRDHIQSLFDAVYKGGVADETKGPDILAALKKLVPDSAAKGPAVSITAPAAKAKPAKEGPAKNATYRIRYRPAKHLFTSGTDPLMQLQELRQLGTCRVVAQTEAIPYLEDYEADGCYTFWDAILTTNKGKNAIEDIFIFVKDSSELTIDVIDEDGGLDNEATYKRLGEILLERGDLTPNDLHKALQTKKKVGEMLVESGIVSCEKVESALAEQQHVREMRERRQGADPTSSIRVATDRLDTLVNLVGELVTVQARLSQTALTRGVPEFLSIAEEVERLTVSLRDNTMSIRMLPIGTTFSKFKRAVRDLSAELGKEIELTTEGAETELDKTVIERLSDPLVHLIRNSIDHGIEMPAAREAAGKQRRGTIHLSAIHSGAHVLIQIRDDGDGLDAEAIRRKAVEKGLVAPDATPSDKELFALILMPDFSTAKKVTSVSGRGVGLDVVKKAIDALHGTIEITSARGAGATITLKLPLTLAIIDGFLTKIGAEHFIFPLASVEECIELKREAAAAGGRHLVNVRGHMVPYISLREQFMITGAPPAIEQIVIVGEEGRRVGFTVDLVVGEHQTVLKSLGKFYKQVEGISGATILGDGTVALILDLPKLISTAEQEENAVTRRTGPALEQATADVPQ
jgi:two-component system chemotaxis sensor kinase CheA